MKKIGALWIQRMLTPLEKQRRSESYNDFLEQCQDDIVEVCNRIVTGVVAMDNESEVVTPKFKFSIESRKGGVEVYVYQRGSIIN